MKIRIISDLHTDVNEEFDISWKNKNLLTVIAGDIAGSLADTKKFLRAKLNNVIFIAGNHMVYNYESKPIQLLYQDLKDEFPIDSNIAFLQDSYKEIDDVVFIGATLWTDFSYNNGMFNKGDSKETITEINMKIAKECMNDYKWGSYLSKDGMLVSFEPYHCQIMFRDSLKFIKKTYDKFADSKKKIVLIVHHGISPQILGRGYTHDELAAEYITDLESYIKTKMPKLSLIIHGHIHTSYAYKIGGVSVICNARGYIDHGLKNTDFNKDLTIDI
ncbi:MAG: metallophosphoesterase [Elusimicrobiota bacterium]|jgi:predicted phosphodiesterase|nr:metallophosphoesterase [Elusimicrobiota bacterium]